MGLAGGLATNGGGVPASVETNASPLGGKLGEIALRGGLFGGQAAVATHGQVSSYVSAFATNGNTRLAHVLKCAVTDVRLVYHNYTRNTSQTEADAPNQIVIFASVEYPTGSTGVIPVTFRGQGDPANGYTLGVNGCIVSDPVPINAPAGATIYTRTYATGATVRASRYTDGTNNEGTNSSATNSSMSGAISGAGNCFGPAAILGTPVGVTNPTYVVCLGDSIAGGVGDGGTGANTGSTASGSSLGFVVRACETNNTACINLAIAGEKGLTFNILSTGFRRKKLLSGTDSGICFVEYGGNDIVNAQTLAQTQATLIAMWQFAAQLGYRVIQGTILPRTTSTDLMQTTVNQTPLTQMGSGQIRTQLNDWIRAGSPMASGAAVAVGTAGALLAGQSGHPLASLVVAGLASAALGYVDLADLCESARNSGFWKVLVNTGTITTASNTTVTVNTGSFANGDALLSANIPADTYVVSGGGTGTLTVSQAATATAGPTSAASGNTGGGTHPSQNQHIAMATAIQALFA